MERDITREAAPASVGNPATRPGRTEDPSGERPAGERPPAGRPGDEGAPDETSASAPVAATRSPASHVGAAVREFVVVVVMALALSFVVKTWLVQAFYIPSGSMEDTLVLDDRVVVNKLVPGVMDLQRGDVVVFEDPGGWLDAQAPRQRQGALVEGVRSVLTFVGLLPSDSDDHLIKRVIGLPGDRVECCTADARLKVNGVPISEPYVKKGDEASSMTFKITVPAGRVWVMGDHRSDSRDSRFHDPSGTGAEGSVPIDKITGRAVAIVWPFGRFGWLSDHARTFATVPTPTVTPAPASTRSPSP